MAKLVLVVGVLIGVEGRAWLGDVCIDVFYRVYFGCFNYIHNLIL